jgi:hypothetical protein
LLPARVYSTVNGAEKSTPLKNKNHHYENIIYTVNAPDDHCYFYHQQPFFCQRGTPVISRIYTGMLQCHQPMGAAAQFKKTGVALMPQHILSLHICQQQ